MKRFVAMSACALALGIGTLSGIPTANAIPPARRAGFAGIYVVYVKWGHDKRWSGWELTLSPNGKGSSSEPGGDITWSRAGKTVTVSLVYPAVEADYTGTKTRAGFNKPRKPGTMTNTDGSSGIWYAVYANRA
jgi:hypothetical protein